MSTALKSANHSICHSPYYQDTKVHSYSDYYSDRNNHNFDNYDRDATPHHDIRYPLHYLPLENCMCYINGNYYERVNEINGVVEFEDSMVCLCYVCSRHCGLNSCHGETCRKVVNWNFENDLSSLSENSSFSDDHYHSRYDGVRKEISYGSHSSDGESNSLEQVVWTPQEDTSSMCCGSRESIVLTSPLMKSLVRRSTKMKLKSPPKATVSALIPLKPSLFADVPPTLFFFKTNDEVVPLPVEIRKLLVWKLSTITPVIIRQTVVRTGYQLTRKNTDWVAMWGKHMKSLQFQEMKESQKVNHFPGSHNLGRKDNLLRNIRRARNLHGESTYNFLPETYILPKDIRLLRKAWEKHLPNQIWIVKPPASARGTGIHLINKWNQVPRKQSAIVQKYIVNPYLINGSKFDLRIYVLVSSFNPLRIYIFDNGLVRFASVKYSHSSSSIENKFMHLTNYSINKSNSSYTSNESENACEGHKWTLKALWGYLARRNINVERLWENIEDIVIKTIICAESGFNRLIEANVASRYMCFELFGFDIMLDSNLRPWLLEVNISPSLHSSSKLDTAVKGQLVSDMLNTVGFHIPDKMSAGLQYALLQKLGLSGKTRRLCLNQMFYHNSLSPEEKAKHEIFEDNPDTLVNKILEELTADDVRHLMQGEDEASRTGHFTRIFPSSTSLDYYKLVRTKRYYNILQCAWELKYNTCRKSGISHLQALCRKGTHLKGPKKPSIGKDLEMEETAKNLQSPQLKEFSPEKKTSRSQLKLVCRKAVFKIPSRTSIHSGFRESPGKTLVKSYRNLRRSC